MTEGASVTAAAPGIALWRVAAIGLGTLAVSLDTAVNIAFPQITAAFGLPLEMIQWIVIAYVVTHAGLMLAFGRIGDLFGHRTVYRLGLIGSAVAFLLCAAAPSYGWLLASRVLQGIAAALVISCGPALLTGLAPEQRRSQMLGLYTMLYALGSALGPLIGGAAIQLWGWQAVFWIRAPIALLALLMVPPLPQVRRAGSVEAFDGLGAFLLCLALTAVLLLLNRLQYIAEQAPMVALLALLVLLSGGGFVRRERRFAHPILDLSIFRDGNFALVNLGNLLTNLAGFAVLLLVPYYLVRVTGLPLALAGAVLALSPLGTMAGSLLGGWLSGRIQAYRAASFGGLLLGGGLLLIGRWDAGTGLAVMGLTLVIQGAGLGLYQVAYMDIVSAVLPPADRGVAGSLAMLTRMVGVVMGATLLSLAFQYLQTAAGGEAAAGPSFLVGFQQTFLLAAALPFAVLALSFAPALARRR